MLWDGYIWFRRIIINFNYYIILLNGVICLEIKRRNDFVVMLGIWIISKIGWIFYLEVI